MGYESQVAIMCEPVAAKHIRNTIDKIATEYGVKFAPDKEFVNDDCITFFWDWVKWYEHDPQYFPHIDCIMKALEFLEEAELENGSFYYCRIGEEIGDYESFGDSSLGWIGPAWHMDMKSLGEEMDTDYIAPSELLDYSNQNM